MKNLYMTPIVQTLLKLEETLSSVARYLATPTRLSISSVSSTGIKLFSVPSDSLCRI